MTTEDIKLIDDILTEVSNSIATGELEEMEIGEYYQEVLRRFKLLQEQSEVNLEKEIDMFVDGWSIDEDLGLVDDEGWSVTVGDIKNVARHFYELGKNSK